MEVIKSVRERQGQGQTFGLGVLAVLMALLGTAGFASAAQLRINPGDGAGNSITLTGDFEFSVYQRNSNIDIEIPGVKIVFDCDTATDPESCTVTVNAAASAQPAVTPTNANPVSDTNTNTSGSGDCVGFGSNTTCSNSSESGASGNNTDASGAANENPPADTTGGEKVCTSMACSSMVTEQTAGEASDATPFATTGRALGFGQDFGSAGANATGNTFPLDLSENQVRVGSFTMKAGAHSGTLAFVPTSKEPLNADLHLWISRSQDGAPLSEACAHVGTFDGAMKISTVTGSGVCELEASGSYYLNVAACASAADDYTCSNGAKNATREGSVYLSSSYRDS